MKEGARVREEEPVVRESSRTQWLRCCREAAWISGVGGEGLLTHLGVGGEVGWGGC